MMNYPLLKAALAALFLSGCGSDSETIEDKPTTPEQPVISTINVDDAEQINLTVDEYRADSQSLLFTLNDGEQKPIIGAQYYDAYFFGFADKKSSNPKAWKRWHVTQTYRCQTEGECTGTLTELGNGQYQFDIPGLNWQAQDPSGAASTVKVSMLIYGAKANSEFNLVPIAP
ncbi:hypothetical protein [Shewanella acanthi]|uniref:hypothetical protein n=1 Tax=Shewanella acanthi TaxID=2864212 RepID=UPI0021ACB3F0|nr:hypothetical protein [Shewanella acanthi]